MCSSLKDILELFKDKYFNDVRLYLKKTKIEEPTDQFKSNYAARSVLEEMKSLINKRIDHCGEETCEKEISILAAIYYLHGCISMDVDENTTGEESLNKSLKLIENDPIHVDNILTVVSCYNQLGLLWCERGDYDKALRYLRESEDFYDKYPKEADPTDFEKLMTDVHGCENGKVALERLHTLTSYYLAQALGASGDSVRAAAYCYKTLRRQLNSPQLDKADWALNAATLSQVLVENNAFKEAKNHLAAASCLLQQLQADLDNTPNPDSEKHVAELEKLSERQAEVCRCWTKYCLNLLTISKDRLLDDTSQPAPPPRELCNLEFEGFEMTEEAKQVSSTYSLTWEDALELYKHGCSWLEQATKHYTLENHASDHVSIVRDHSQLYMALAFFTDDIAKQCKMHKRRIDMLIKVSDQLNPQFYMDHLRQLWFEVGETYITLIDLKSDQIPKVRNDYVTKINNLAKQGASVFQTFITSFDDHKNSQRYEEGYERSVLLSKIHEAQLLMKIKTDDMTLLIQYTTVAYNNYKDIVDYCEKWKVTNALSPCELQACKEMALLLPIKLKKLLMRN